MAEEWARFRGAAQVIAVDRIPDRLELVVGRGAIPVNFDDEDVIARCRS